jgi:electron transport complex protein RnfG
MNDASRSTLRNAALLAVFASATAGALALMVAATHDRIQAEQRRAEQEALRALLPEGGFDNDPVTDRVDLIAPDGLGDGRPRRIHRARAGNTPIAAVMSVVAPDGYSGAIELLVGVRTDGSVVGVRVVSHRETPGLGDPIEAAKSDWIRGFDGRSLGQPPAERWAVRRDGGDFDQFAGATISPRAVVGAVKRALQWFMTHQELVFATPTDDDRTP